MMTDSTLTYIQLCLHSGGDSNTQHHDAETFAKYPNIYVYGSDSCSGEILTSFSTALDGASVKYVTMFVSNSHIRIVNDCGLDETVCHKCLYALNGQPDTSSGGPNEDIYVGLNRIIKSMSRVGVGICKAKFSWKCPIDMFP